MFIFNPLEQFEIEQLFVFKIPFLPLGGAGAAGTSLTYTNTGLYLTIGVITVIGLASIRSKERLISERIIINEIIWSSLLRMVIDQIGKKEERYIGIIYGIFSIILVSNLLGMIPYSFTVTSHFILTLSLSVAIMIGVTIIGFEKHGITFLSILVPEGTPIALLPIVTLLELLSYTARAISLGVRLAANCLAGHTLLKIISSFSWKLTSTSILIPLISLPFLSALIGLELGIAFLQSYVFTTLTCSYIRDSINLH